MSSDPTHPVVSVVLVDYRTPEQTLEAIAGLRQLEWPQDRLEIVVVDNDPAGGAVDRIRADAPGVVVVPSGANLGFAGGCNRGAAAATGAFVAFLNNDARPDPRWIAAAIDAFDDDSIGAVASRVLDWEGQRVDFIDAALTWYGKGSKPMVGERAAGIGERAKDVLFGTGAAMIVRREVFERLGGFDERFFMFYEDVDFGWRLNLLGLRYRYEPSSIAYHRHHGTAGALGSDRERYYLERNALMTVYKNVEERRLGDAIAATMALSVRRAAAAGGLDTTAFDYRSGAVPPQQTIPDETLAGWFAIDQFVAELPALAADRAAVQRSRVVSDAVLAARFGLVDAPERADPDYTQGYDDLLDAFPDAATATATRVVIITGDPIGAKMAGPAIRAWNMALLLSERAEVTLLTMSTLEPLDAPFALARIRAGDDRAFAKWEQWASIIVFQGHAMDAFEAIETTEKLVVADVYDPMHFEQLEQGRELGAVGWERAVVEATATMNDQIARADFLLCASERQRMLYLGQLAGLGRVTPATYADDPDLRRLLDVAPFGIPDEDPQRQRHALRGQIDGIGDDERILIWGGGLYSWFDPHTLIRAVAALAERRPTVRLFFQGTKHPHPGVPEMEIVSTSRELARSLGVLDTAVVFNDSWVEYTDRQNYLLDADAGVSTHFDHIETTFSFRTRILDYLWAGLPMVVTAGDSFADLVETEGLGIVVPAEDEAALEAALERILFDEAFIAAATARIAEVRERFRWRVTLAPLVAFVDDPRPSGDRGREVGTGRRKRRRGFARDVELVMHHLRNGGPTVVFRKVAARLRGH